MNYERVVEWVDQDEQPRDYHYEEVHQGSNHEAAPQGINREIVPQNLKLWEINFEELGSDSEEKYFEDYDRRHEKSLDYKINIDIAIFYGQMHVGEFLYCISDVEIFF